MSQILNEGHAVIGSRIGPYTIQRELGRGGMGSVYLAERQDDQLRMKVCVKILHGHLNQKHDVEARFRRERQLLADLRHPHIAVIHDAGSTDDNRPYFIMEYIEGHTIDVWCHLKQPSLTTLLETLLKTTRALAHAHAQGVIHRDIKPHNLMVTNSGEPKLLDFGIAHLVGLDPNKARQNKRNPMTPAYAAPEQHKLDKITPATDIYSLGLVLLQLLTTRSPREHGCSPQEVVDQLVSGCYRAPSTTLPAEQTTVDAYTTEQAPAIVGPMIDMELPPLPEAVGYVVRRCLAENPRERFGDGADLIAALERVIAALSRDESQRSTRTKHIDAVFWYHSKDHESVGAVAKALSEHHEISLFPAPETSLEALSERTWEASLADGKSCVICLGHCDHDGTHEPWLENPALRDAVAFYAGEMNLIPLLLPGAKIPNRQSALPAFIRGCQWLRADKILESGETEPLYQAICRNDQEDADQLEPTGSCPFRGLEVFREQDHHLFFGREALTQRIVEYLAYHPFIAVLGPSGSGKSSVVQAGVIPELRQRDYALALFTPTHHPLEELAYALNRSFGEGVARKSPDRLLNRLQGSEEALHFIGREVPAETGKKRLCLVIDQFEEIFTLADRDEAAAFVATLSHAVAQPGGIAVLLTMRSDFLGKCVIHPDINDLIMDNGLQTKPMNRNELTRAIREPARIGGLTLESGLLDRLLDDVAGAVGELPLLEHALLELYERRQGGLLTRAAYDEIGGIAGALAKRAESEYSALNAADRQTLRKMFVLCLVHPGEGAEDTRRRATMDELTAVGGEKTGDLLGRWTESRLLTATRDPGRGLELVDVAHEALIRNWHRIGEWMAEDRATAQSINRLRRRAEAWEEANRDPDHLLRGGLLQQMVDLKEEHGDHLGPLALTFLNEGINQRGREYRTRLRIRRAITGLGVASMVLAVIASLMYMQSRAAERNAKEATAQALLEKKRAQAQTLESNYHLALTLNEQAGNALDESPIKAWLFSLAALSQEIPADLSLPDPVGRLLDPRLQAKGRMLWTSPPATPLAQLAVSDDGATLALADPNGVVRILNVASGRQEALLTQARHGLTALTFSPDGQWLAAASEREDVYLWNMVDPHFNLVTDAHSGAVTALVFSQDSQWLATADAEGEVIVHDVVRHRQSHQLSGLGPVQHLAFLGEQLFAAIADQGPVALGSIFDKQLSVKKLAHDGDAPIVSLTCYRNTTVLTADAAGGLHFYQARGRRTHSINLNTPISRLCTSPQTDVVAVYDHENHVSLWKPEKEPRMVWRHEDKPVAAAALSPTGLVFLDPGGTLDRLNLGDGTSLGGLVGHRSDVNAVVFSPNGRFLVSSSDDGTVRLWDTTAGKAVKTIASLNKGVCTITFSPDGKYLCVAGGEGFLRLWSVDGTNFREIAALRGHGNAVWGAAFSPDGKRLATGSADQTLRLWDLEQLSEDMEATKVLTGHQGIVYRIAYSPDGRLLASGSADGTIRLWDVSKEGRETQKSVLKGHGNTVFFVAFSPDGNTLVSSSGDATIRMWDLRNRPEKNGPISVLKGHTGAVYTLTYSPDGRFLASTSEDQTVRLWDLSVDPALIQPVTTLRGHSDTVRSVAFSPDGQRLASGSSDRTIRLWEPHPTDNEAEQAAVFRGHAAGITAVSFTPDGNLFATASADRTLRLWRMDGKDGRPRAGNVLRGHNSVVFGLDMSPDGRRLASGSFDQTVRLWNLEDTAEAPIILRGHEKPVFGVAFSPDGRRLASADADSLIRLWSVDEPNPTSTALKGHQATVHNIAFSPDGQFLASASRDRTVGYWDVTNTNDSPPQPTLLKGHSNDVWKVAFSPDGARLASTSSDLTVRLWDVTGPPTPLTVLRGHGGAVYGASFSPDSRYLISSSADATVRIWDVTTGRALAVLAGHKGGVLFGPAFHPNGRLLITPSEDQTLRLWRLDQMLLPNDGRRPHVFYREILDRSLFQMGYHFDGAKLTSFPSLRLNTPVQSTTPSAWEHLSRPRPHGAEYLPWLLGQSTL